MRHDLANLMSEAVQRSVTLVDFENIFSKSTKSRKGCLHRRRVEVPALRLVRAELLDCRPQLAELRGRVHDLFPPADTFETLTKVNASTEIVL